MSLLLLLLSLFKSLTTKVDVCVGGTIKSVPAFSTSAYLRAGGWLVTAESCDTIDNDCDGTVDEDPTTGGTTFYTDTDGDGYGEGDGIVACAAGKGESPTTGDCDPSNPLVSPGATETCNGIDDDCDGDVDDGAPMSTWYADADADGHGAGDPILACEAPAGGVTTADDCNDADAAVHPGATDTCDFVDTDCDGTTDDDATLYTWWSDGDQDGYGSGDPFSGRVRPMDVAIVGGDCDDGAIDVNPGASDDCDGVDSDCDGTVDDEATFSPWYTDEDGDGYGAAETFACAAPTGAVAVDGDCDDLDAGVSPGATDDCDGVDSDCDGTVDDVKVTWTTSTGTTDLTTTFEAGTASAPVAWSTTTSGTLQFCDGTWYTNLRATGSPMNLTVESVSGDPDTTILDAGGSYGLGVATNSGAVKLQGLTIQNASYGYTVDYGGPGPTVSLTDVNLLDNTYGMLVVGGSAFLKGTRIEGSSAAGLSMSNSWVTVSDDSLLQGNTIAIRNLGSTTRTTCRASALVDNGVALQVEGTLSSSGCDFGTTAGGDDNGPGEVTYRHLTTTTTLHPRDNATFGCSAGSCGAPSAEQLHTATALTETLSGEGGIGVLLTAETDFTLRGFAWPVEADGCAPTYTLYEGYTLDSTSITPGVELATWSPAATATSSALSGWGYYSGDAWIDIDEGQDYYLELSYACASGTSMDVGLDDAPAASSVWTQTGVVSWTTAGDFLADPGLAPVTAQLLHVI